MHFVGIFQSNGAFYNWCLCLSTFQFSFQWSSCYSHLSHFILISILIFSLFSLSSNSFTFIVLPVINFIVCFCQNVIEYFCVFLYIWSCSVYIFFLLVLFLVFLELHFYFNYSIYSTLYGSFSVFCNELVLFRFKIISFIKCIFTLNDESFLLLHIILTWRKNLENFMLSFSMRHLFTEKNLEKF